MEEIIFESGSVPVIVAARVYGKDASWVRAGIISGWLPIGKATRNGKLVTNIEEMNSRYGRINFYISPKLLYEETGYLWKAKDKIEKNPVTNREVIITERGNTLCYDAVSGRYFKSDIDKLKKAANELNRQMRDEMYISLNDFYYEIGLNPVSIGDELGWNIDQGYIDLSFSSQLADDGTPCLVIEYHIAPRYDFRTA